MTAFCFGARPPSRVTRSRNRSRRWRLSCGGLGAGTSQKNRARMPCQTRPQAYLVFPWPCGCGPGEASSGARPAGSRCRCRHRAWPKLAGPMRSCGRQAGGAGWILWRPEPLSVPDPSSLQGACPPRPVLPEPPAACRPALPSRAPRKIPRGLSLLLRHRRRVGAGLLVLVSRAGVVRAGALPRDDDVVHGPERAHVVHRPKRERGALGAGGGPPATGARSPLPRRGDDRRPERPLDWVPRTRCR